MKDFIKLLLDKCDSTYLAELWLFYRNYFNSDKSCVEFLQSVFNKEPNREEIWKLKQSADENIFIPRRMVNTTMRLVSAAKDMEQIRTGKDIFKIVYLVSCIETLQTLRGKSYFKKYKMIEDFFTTYVSEDDKRIIQEKFKRSLGDNLFEPQLCKDDNPIPKYPQEKITIEEFSNILYGLRNCASHEGEYWDFTFNHQRNAWEMVNIKHYVKKNIENHVYETKLTYNEFQDIFVRTCINFINKYIAEH